MILNVDRSPPEHAVHSTGSWGVGASAGPATEGLNRDFPDASQILDSDRIGVRVGKGLRLIHYRKKCRANSIYEVTTPYPLT